ncbi:hypothetical protein OROHE_019271 [Orobanche hederae]
MGEYDFGFGVVKMISNHMEVLLLFDARRRRAARRPVLNSKILKKEAPEKEVERLIIRAGGVKPLISFVHGVAAIYKAKKERSDSLKGTKLENAESKHCPTPDGLSKTEEEMEEEENATMPYSPYTRLLIARGRHTA